LTENTETGNNSDYFRPTQKRNFLNCVGVVQQIKFQTPTDFTYEQVWESAEHRGGITFGVAACSDVHIVLATKVRMFNDMFDVVIGGWYNSRSDPNSCANGLHLMYNYLLDITLFVLLDLEV
jgi:hypothetical protein